MPGATAVQPTDQTTAPQLMGDDEFALAFDSASTDAAAPAAVVPDDVAKAPEAAAEDKPVEAAPAADDKPVEAAKPAEPAKVVEEPKPVEAAKPVEPSAAEVAAAAADKEQKDAALAAAAAALNPTEEEKALLATLEADWPDTHKALMARERMLTAKFEKMLDERLATMGVSLDERLNPITATAAEIARERFDTAVKAEHPDAFTILPEVEAWVAKQPSFLQAGYNQVLDAGTVKDVVALMSLFKEATGKVTPAVLDSAEAVAAAAAVTAVKARKLDSQAGVKTRGVTAKPSGPAEDDFEGGFNVAAAQ